MKKQAQYMVGIYCRLSKDDLGSSDSSSITSQKSMLEKYVRDNSWIIYDYYVDDGYSGTNYNRPAFERMIVDIEAGKINMVVVKDLSRLGRNYILTGQYTDIYFPDRNVRFIALNDGIDTQNNENSIVPFKNILNQMYSEDISKKVRSAVNVKKQKGEFLSNYAPYGYETEQSEVQQSIDELKPEIQQLSEDKRDITAWLELIRNYADIQELDRIILGELVEKITVSEIQVIDGVKNIEITIYYRFVGAISSIKWILRGVPRFKQWFILPQTPLL